MSMTKRDVERCAQFLQQNDQYLIGTHRRPDGDTVGSAAALCRALRQLGKTAYVLENTQITPRYAPYLAEYLRPAGWEPAHVICVDVADESMLSPNPECYENRTDLVIDHHGSNPGFGRINLIEPGYAAAAELVYEVILALGVPLDEQMALAIYLGVATDTGGFHYSNTTVHSHLVAADCMRFDQIDFGKLNLQLFEIKTRARLYLEERIIRTLEFRMDGRLTVAAITRRDREETGVTWDDLESISSVPRQIEGVEAAITLIELEGKVKLSIRTNLYMDAAAVCRRLGGGGHVRAAGALVPGTLDAVRRRTVAIFEEMYGDTERPADR